MHALGHDALPYVREALDMDWVGNPLLNAHYRAYAPPISGSIFQPTQDHDLRRIHRDSEKHHLANDPRTCKRASWNSTTAKSSSRYKTHCSASFHATTISTSAARSPRPSLGIPPRPGSSTPSSVCCRCLFPRSLGVSAAMRVDVMVVMEQFGQGLLLEPYLSTVVTCGGLLRDAGADALKQKLLPQICGGQAASCRWPAYEAAGRYDLSLRGLHGGAEAAAAGSLSGRKTVVLDGASADYFLVICAQRRQGRRPRRHVAVSGAARCQRTDRGGLSDAIGRASRGSCCWRMWRSARDALIGAAGRGAARHRARCRPGASRRCAPKPSASSMR